MLHTELELRVRHEELRRLADHERLVREAADGRRRARHAARAPREEAEGRVRGVRGWVVRARRAA